ncbi:MAG TPA: hypothetical protein VME01_01390, partial [Solirubrobacteraceae bacterium]|nr:hypothetical protein [Solirubrobacteraceae bacterium]
MARECRLVTPLAATLLALLTLVSGARAGTLPANSVVPSAKTYYVVETVPGHPGEFKLERELIKPVNNVYELSTCFSCGRGNFERGSYNSHDHTETIPAKGDLIVTSRTLVATVVYNPGKIARFWLYRLDLKRLRWVHVAQGCVAADVVPTASSRAVAWGLAHLKNLHAIPQVPCKSPTDSGDSLSWDTPWEVPASGSAQGTVAGHASGTRRLSIFEARARCAADAQAEAALAPAILVRRVSGDFSLSFSTSPDSSPGYFCMYLQTGGLYQGIPDGILTVVASPVFYSGDSLTITLPTSSMASFTGVASSA